MLLLIKSCSIATSPRGSVDEAQDLTDVSLLGGTKKSLVSLTVILERRINRYLVIQRLFHVAEWVTSLDVLILCCSVIGWDTKWLWKQASMAAFLLRSMRGCQISRNNRYLWKAVNVRVLCPVGEWIIGL
jgi:hypothetical protein